MFQVDCVGYQNLNTRYHPIPDHTFESETDGQDGLCPNCLQKLRELWLNNLLEPRHKAMTFDSFNVEKNKTVYDKALKYAKSDNGSLVMWGKRYGTGKTHLAIAIAKYTIENWPMTSFNYPLKCPVEFATESDLLDSIRATFNGNEGSEHEIIDGLANSKLLIYDDVGKVTPQNTDFLHRISFLLIDRIYRKCGRLVLTSNLGMAELSLHLGEACVSRLHEMGEIVEVKGLDYRLTSPTTPSKPRYS